MRMRKRENLRLLGFGGEGFLLLRRQRKARAVENVFKTTPPAYLGSANLTGGMIAYEK